MSVVNTVTGAIDSSKLGRTLMHEHVLVIAPGALEDPLASWDMEAATERVSGELRAVKARGISTVVDANSIAMGRRVDFLAAVARSSGVNIVAATGFYDRRYISGYFSNMTVEQLTEIIEREVTERIRDSDVRAGVIKASIMSDIAAVEEKVLRAAARASRSARVPIITHTEGVMGIKLLDILESEGADPAHVVVGHSCGSSDIRYHLEILKRGAYLGFDRVGYEHFQRDEVRLIALTGLIASGWARQITMSMDMPVEVVGRPSLAALKQPPKKLTYLHDEFIPRLLKAGVAQQSIDQILSDNPRRIFEM